MLPLGQHRLEGTDGGFLIYAIRMKEGIINNLPVLVITPPPREWDFLVCIPLEPISYQLLFRYNLP